MSTPPRKDFRTRLKDVLPDWATWVIPVGVAWATFMIVSPSEPRYRTLHSPTRPVQVSSYTRSDGTEVSGYSRAESGERARADAINEPIARHNRREGQDYKDGRINAWTVAAFVLWIVRAYLTDD